MARGRGILRAALAGIEAVRRDEHATLLVLAVVIGLVAGLVVGAFYRVIDLVQKLVLQGAGESALPAAVLVPLAVAAGIAVARSLVHWGARDADGDNVPDVMYRVTMRGGAIASAPVLFKTLASAVTIGTGGSVGAEGPVIVAGAAAASRVGRWLRASPNRLRTLVGCGAAAGLAAAFNAPIAGVLFGVEKILGTAGGLTLGPFVVASIIASAVARALFGDVPVFRPPAEYGLHSAWELLLYAVLGLLTGAVAVAYARGVWHAHDRFGRVRSLAWRVVIGAAIVGALNLLFRADLWGHGHEVLDLGMVTRREPLHLLGLAAGKLVATAVTLAAVGTGGVFTPALFIGATTGGAVGAAAHGLFGGISSLAPGAFALAGMAGLVAGATHAPLTAMMLVFETTRDYDLILPVMLTATLAYLVARRLHPESVYTEWLTRRGVHLSHGADAALLGRIPVRECLNREPATIPEDAGLDALLTLVQETRQTEYPVVGSGGRLTGMLTQQALRDALQERERLGALVIAADLAAPVPDALTPDDSLLTALRRLGNRDVGTLPVVAVEDRARLVGTVSRLDLFATYERFLTAEQH